MIYVYLKDQYKLEIVIFLKYWKIPFISLTHFKKEWVQSIYKNKHLQENRDGLCIDFLKNHYIYSKFFIDSDFIKLYLHQLSVLSESKYLDNFFNEISGEMKLMMNKIYREDPFYEYPREFLYQNQKFIKKKIYPKDGIASYYNGLLAK